MLNFIQSLNPFKAIGAWMDRLNVAQDIKTVNQVRSTLWREFDIYVSPDEVLTEKEVDAIRDKLLELCRAIHTAKGDLAIESAYKRFCKFAEICDALMLFGEDAEDIKGYAVARVGYTA